MKAIRCARCCGSSEACSLSVLRSSGGLRDVERGIIDTCRHRLGNARIILGIDLKRTRRASSPNTGAVDIVFYGRRMFLIEAKRRSTYHVATALGRAYR